MLLGVIFTGIGACDEPALKDKVERAVREAVSPEGSGPERNALVTFHIFPEEKADAIDLTLYPELEKKKTPSRVYLAFKRVIDVIGALFAILLFSPFFILIPLLIRLSSKGPVLFRQKRIGRLGRPFTFLKFRSMHIGNDEKVHMEYVRKLILEEKAYKGSPGVYKIMDDPRITRIGRLLRKTSLDELPQFINVLKGDMSLVGPRPPIPYELESYDSWHRRRYLEPKPGITGLWQVEGRSRTTFNEMVRMDIRYLQEKSLWFDIKLIVKTPWALITSRGAY
ncbi:MAG: sugar transferase [Deltaproteobacteria bacterium]|nr:sugar transferase [Deltaproteobacteria bacterium]